MKTLECSVSNALREVWEAKKAVYEDTKDMTPQEVVAYFKKHSDDFDKELAQHRAENSGGASSMG